MISCYQFKNYISDFIDKEISFRNRKLVEEHLGNCSSCKELFQSILNTKISMNNFAEITVSDDFMLKLRNRILADRNARIQLSRKNSYSFSKIPSFIYGFAAALLIVVVGFFIFRYQKYGVSSAVAPPIVQEQIQKMSPGSPRVAVPVDQTVQGQYVSSDDEKSNIDSSRIKYFQGQRHQRIPDKNLQDRIKTVKGQR